MSSSTDSPSRQNPGHDLMCPFHCDKRTFPMMHKLIEHLKNHHSKLDRHNPHHVTKDMYKQITTTMNTLHRASQDEKWRAVYKIVRPNSDDRFPPKFAPTLRRLQLLAYEQSQQPSELTPWGVGFVDAITRIGRERGVETSHPAVFDEHTWSFVALVFEAAQQAPVTTQTLQQQTLSLQSAAAQAGQQPYESTVSQTSPLLGHEGQFSSLEEYAAWHSGRT